MSTNELLEKSDEKTGSYRSGSENISVFFYTLLTADIRVAC